MAWVNQDNYVDHNTLEPRTNCDWSKTKTASLEAAARLGLTKESIQPEQVESIQHGAPKVIEMITAEHGDDVFIAGSTLKTIIDGEVSCLSTLRGEVAAAKFAKAADELTCDQRSGYHVGRKSLKQDVDAQIESKCFHSSMTMLHTAVDNIGVLQTPANAHWDGELVNWNERHANEVPKLPDCSECRDVQAKYTSIGKRQWRVCDSALCQRSVRRKYGF